MYLQKKFWDWPFWKPCIVLVFHWILYKFVHHSSNGVKQSKVQEWIIMQADHKVSLVTNVCFEMRQSLLVFSLKFTILRFSYLTHLIQISVRNPILSNIFLWLLSIDMYAELGGSKMIYLIVLIEIKMICFSNKEWHFFIIIKFSWI